MADDRNTNQVTVEGHKGSKYVFTIVAKEWGDVVYDRFLKPSDDYNNQLAKAETKEEIKESEGE